MDRHVPETNFKDGPAKPAADPTPARGWELDAGCYEPYGTPGATTFDRRYGGAGTNIASGPARPVLRPAAAADEGDNLLLEPSQPPPNVHAPVPFHRAQVRFRPDAPMLEGDNLLLDPRPIQSEAGSRWKENPRADLWHDVHVVAQTGLSARLEAPEAPSLSSAAPRRRQVHTNRMMARLKAQRALNLVEAAEQDAGTRQRPS